MGNASKKGVTRRVAPTFFEFGGTGFQPVLPRRDACATITFSPFPIFARVKNLGHHFSYAAWPGADHSRDFSRKTDNLQKEKVKNPCIGVS